MSNPSSYSTRGQENKEFCHKLVQTDEVFFMTEKEQIMLYFIKIFNIDILNLSNLCYGVVYNYSSRRYTVDTEPIKSDSEDEDSSKIMNVVDETTINKLIEESQKNKELIYNLIYKTDNNMHQSIKERNKQIASTSKQTESIGINTELTAGDIDVIQVKRKAPNLTIEVTDVLAIDDVNLRPAQPTDPRNIILNKWAKDNNQYRGQSSCSNRNQNQSKVQVTNVQMIQSRNNLDEKNQHQSTTSITLCNPLQVKKRDMQIYYDEPLSDSETAQDHISSNEQDDSTQETVIVSHTVLSDDSDKTIPLGLKTPHLESVNYEIKNTEQTDRNNQSIENDPIPLLQKVPQTLGINVHRARSVSNPRPGREYKSPYIKMSYPMLSYNEIQFYEENWMHFQRDIDCNNLCQIQQLQKQQKHEQNLHHQQMLEHLNRQEMKINYLCYHVDSLHKVLGRQQAPGLQSPLPSPSSTARPAQANPPSPVAAMPMESPVNEIQSPISDGQRNNQNSGNGVFPFTNNHPSNDQESPVRAILTQNAASEYTSKDSVPRKRPYMRRNNLRRARINPIKPSIHDLRTQENVPPPYYYNMWPHDVHRWPYHPDQPGPHNTARMMNMSHGRPHVPNMYGPHGMHNVPMMHMPSGKQNNAPITQVQQGAQRNVPTAQKQHGQQSNELITDKSHGAPSNESIIQELLEAQSNGSVTQGLRGTHTKDSMAEKLHEAQNNVRTQWLHGTQSNECQTQKFYKTQSHMPTMQGLHRVQSKESTAQKPLEAQSNAPVTQGPHGTQCHGAVAHVPQVPAQKAASMTQEWQEAAARLQQASGWPQRFSSYDAFRSQFKKYQ